MSRFSAARAALVLLLSLLVAACGGAAGSQGSAAPSTGAGTPAAESTDGPGEFPVTVEAANGPVTIDAAPEAIVSLSPTGTEMLYAIGAGDAVVAVDSFSNYPSEAPTTDLSMSEPNIEAIAGYDPDLVVFGDDDDQFGAALADLGIPALSLPSATTLDEAYDQIAQLGQATGHVDEATEVVEQMRSEIEEIVAGLPSETAEPLSIYHELDDTYYSATSNTFIGQLYEMVGVRNIADEAPGEAGDYPQLSSEFIVDANPDLIFLADAKCCGQSPETVAERAGWDQITAVANDAVISLDDDVASRWGPRVVELLRTIADAVAEHGATTP